MEGLEASGERVETGQHRAISDANSEGYACWIPE